MRVAGMILMTTTLLGMGAAPARAAEATAERLFQEANRAYANGQYQEARERYEQLSRRAILSERLYYNLGNAYFRLGELGRAIWAYERALRIDEDLEEARHNLEIAREAVSTRFKDRVVGERRPPFWKRLTLAFSSNLAALSFLVCWYAAFGLVVAVLLLRRGVLRTTLIVIAVVVGIFTLVSGRLYMSRIEYDEQHREAIVLEETLPVREGPRGIATKAFEIHAGLRVEIAAEEDRWYKIRLANGLEGWVRADAVGEL